MFGTSKERYLKNRTKKKGIRLTTWDVKNPVSSKYWDKLPISTGSPRTPPKKNVFGFRQVHIRSIHGFGASDIWSSEISMELLPRPPKNSLCRDLFYPPLVCSIRCAQKQPTTLKEFYIPGCFVGPVFTHLFSTMQIRVTISPTRTHPPSLFDLALACAPAGYLDLNLRTRFICLDLVSFKWLKPLGG